MTDIVRYGSWNAYGDRTQDTVEATVLAQVRTRDSAWCTRVEKTGAFAQITADYRTAVNAALPKGVSLIYDTFHGPANPVDFTWERGELDLHAVVQAVDLASIVEANDPDL